MSPNGSQPTTTSTVAGSGAVAALPPKPGSGRGANRGKGLIAAGVAALLLVGGGVTWATTRSGGDKHVTIGTTEASEPYWGVFEQIAKKHGIDIKTVNFSDYTQANPSLQQGQLDANAFQHLLFLANYNVSNHADLKAVGATYVVPLSLYSKKYTKLSQLPANAQVAIPNDPTNQGRALLVLQRAGLLKLKAGGNALATPADVLSSKVKLVPVDAAQTVTSLPSVAAAVINNNFALDAKLDPKSALFADDPSSADSQPYINVIAVRASDVDNATDKELVQIYHDPAVVAAIKKQSRGTTAVVSKTPAQLNAILAQLEAQVKAK